MANANGQFVDLTLDSDDEPPRKRLRHEPPVNLGANPASTNTQTSHESASQAIAKHVFPKVEHELTKLEDGYFNRPSLAQEVRNIALRRLLEDGELLALGARTAWKLTPQREKLIGTQVQHIVHEIKELYRLPFPQAMNYAVKRTNPPKASASTTSPLQPWSPSGLAHRPVVKQSPSFGTPSPVPLPTYVQGRQLSAVPTAGTPESSSVPPLNSVASFISRTIRKNELLRRSPPAGRTPLSTTFAKNYKQTPLNDSGQGAVQQSSGCHPPDAATRSNTLSRLAPGSSKTPSQAPEPAHSMQGLRSRHTPSLPAIRGQELHASRKPSNAMPSVSLSDSITITQVAKSRPRAARPTSSNRPSLTARHGASGLDPSVVRPKPFLSAQERMMIDKCIRDTRSSAPQRLDQPLRFHVDIDDDELDAIKTCLRTIGERPLSLQVIKTLPQRTQLATLLSSKLSDRTVEDMHNFLEDLPAFNDQRPHCQVSMAKDDFLHQQRRRDRRLNALRLTREMNGGIEVGSSMSQQNIHTEVLKDLSDSIGHTFARFGQCSGDVATMSWVSEGTLVCGATSTMDDRTIQHNHSGNLILYSAASDKLEVFKEHRELRPVKEGESSDFSRDKWLYPSVVASATDSKRNLVFTAAFDKTVKVWRTGGTSATSMSAVGTWPHEGKVNFVAAALNGSGFVATAADVSAEAVRVYKVDELDPSASPYKTLTCPRHDANGSDEWGYWPSTMQWGTAEGTQHLLAVGYSPRSRDGDENQIPEDKMRTGAILIWDSETDRVIPVHAPTMANVFETIWHPRLPQLIVATARSGPNVERGVHTQIRIWKQDPDRRLTDQGWHEYKTLDCHAEDINELTVMPVSSHHTYITASCTSGEIFVWDTARGDRPIHVLKHGPTVEPFEDEDERKRRDVGVKFTAWGHTPDRLFTGSSDGKVNLWNVRKKRPFIRTIMQGEGAIFCGTFSPDKTMLAVGDGTGAVWLFTDPDRHADSWGKPCAKRHIPVISDPVEGTSGEDEDEAYHRKRWLDSGELVLSGNPVIGAVQGAAYHNSTHFDKKSHLNEDVLGPLIPTVERQQQAALRATPQRKKSMRRLKPVVEHSDQAVELHAVNYRKDLHVERLSLAEVEALQRDGVEFDTPKEQFDYDSDS